MDYQEALKESTFISTKNEPMVINFIEAVASSEGDPLEIMTLVDAAVIENGVVGELSNIIEQEDALEYLLT